MTPVAKPAQSPFANVTGRTVRGVTSKDRCGSTHHFSDRDLRTWCPHGVAYTSTRTDADRHGGVWTRAGRRRTGQEIRAGDIVWFEPGERRWHGASPTTAITHIAIAERLDGKVVEWMEHVTDEQYGG